MTCVAMWRRSGVEIVRRAAETIPEAGRPFPLVYQTRDPSVGRLRSIALTSKPLRTPCDGPLFPTELPKSRLCQPLGRMEKRSFAIPFDRRLARAGFAGAKERLHNPFRRSQALPHRSRPARLLAFGSVTAANEPTAARLRQASSIVFVLRRIASVLPRATCESA